MRERKLVSMKDMAKILGIGYRSMQRMAYKKSVPFILVNSQRRFDPEEVIAALKKRKAENGN